MNTNGEAKEFNIFSIMSKKNKREAVREMKTKITELEEACENYSTQFKRLNHRIELLEKSPRQQIKEEPEFDWENSFKQEKEAKDAAEFDLADATDALRYAEEKLALMEENSHTISTLESRLEEQLNEMHVLQNKIEELQNKAEGAENRERELMEELQIANGMQQELKVLQKKYTSLISENDELHRRLTELTNTGLLLEQAKQRLTETESLLEAHDYEKIEIKSTVDNILAENTALTNKLKELLEKFTEEKYAG